MRLACEPCQNRCPFLRSSCSQIENCTELCNSQFHVNLASRGGSAYLHQDRHRANGSKSRRRNGSNCRRSIHVHFGMMMVDFRRRQRGDWGLRACESNLPRAHLNQCNYQLVLESQLPHKTVKLIFQLVTVLKVDDFAGELTF